MTAVTVSARPAVCPSCFGRGKVLDPFEGREWTDCNDCNTSRIKAPTWDVWLTYDDGGPDERHHCVETVDSILDAREQSIRLVERLRSAADRTVPRDHFRGAIVRAFGPGGEQVYHESILQNR